MLVPAPAPAAAALRIAIVGGAGGPHRESVAAFVAQLGLEAVLQPLESVRGVDYAIVLVPPGEPGPEFLLDIGYLFAIAGRGRLCFIAQSKPALPAVLDGIARHAIDDSGLWRLLLAREMRQAGLDVDLNRAI